MHVAEPMMHFQSNWTVFPASQKLLFLVKEPVQSTSNVPTTHGLHVTGGVFESLSVQSDTVWGAGDREGNKQVTITNTQLKRNLHSVPPRLA